jgi:DNA-binding FadR family transcriptional regulator
MDVLEITRSVAGGVTGYDRVHSFIREQLLSGRLKTGDKLLPERDLAKVLGVSRPVIREALRALAAIGVVEVLRGQGTVVRAPDFRALSDIFSVVLAQQSNVTDDIMEARIAIERHAIRLACKRALPSDLDDVDQAFRGIVRTIDEPILGAKADFNFHTKIVEASHSSTLASIYAAISNILQRSHAERRQQIIRAGKIDSFLIDHHRKILDALCARDADLSERLLVEHFAIGAEFRRAQMPQ